ncbi:MAG: aminoglycoside phosphotransferase family protein [Candidatus Limnocylindrales bacterium]
MVAPQTRSVTLVLATPDGDVLGRLPPFDAATPWWQDAQPVVRGARETFGLDVTVLRLLEADLPSAHGGAVTYLAEVDSTRLGGRYPGVPLQPWTGDLPDHPMRPGYARPGGPTADLAWADGALAERGLARTGPAEQIRTWNLSSLWRLPTTAGRAWLKVVPFFFAHEGDVLARLAGEHVPALLGHDGARILLAEIPGEDRYGAPLPELLAMIDLLVDLQRRWLGRADELLSVGLPDWRGPALTASIAHLVERAGRTVQVRDRAALDRFVRDLPARMAAIDACGIGDGLVHGDFHPGNVRGDADALVILDWGDAGVGHPLLDQPRFLSDAGTADPAILRERWHSAWRRAIPGSDPDRATALLAPVAAARLALIYQRFLDGIEPSEHRYHQADVAHWLRRTAQLLPEPRHPGERAGG